MTSKGNRQIGTVMSGVKPFLRVRAIITKNSRIMNVPSIILMTFSFFSLLISSVSVYSVIGLFFILFFVDHFKVADASYRSYSDLFFTFFNVEIVNAVNIDHINRRFFSGAVRKNVVLR